MSDGLNLASAYLEIIPSLRGAQGEIAKGLAGAGSEGEKAGGILGVGLAGSLRARLASVVPGVGAFAGNGIGGALLGALKHYAAPVAGVVAGLVSVEAVKKSVEAFETLGTTTFNLQKVIGGTAAQASGFVGAMQLTGVGADQAGTALKIFGKNVGNAALNSKQAAKLTTELGFSFQDAHGKTLPMSVLLPKVADQFQKLPAGAAKTALAMNLFGRSGTILLPFLNQGAAGIAKLTGKANDMGLVLNNLSEKIFLAARQSTLDYKNAIEGASVAVGADFAVALDGSANIARAVVIPALEGLAKIAAVFRPVFLSLGAIADTVSERLRALTTAGVNALVGGLTSLVKPAQAGIDAFGRFVSSITAGAARLASGSFGPIVTAIRSVASGLQAAAGGALGGFIASLLALYRAISPLGIAFRALAPVLPSLVEVFRSLGASLSGALASSLRAIVPAITVLAGILAKTLASAVQGLAPSITSLSSSLSGALGSAVIAILPPLTQLAVVALQVVGAILQFIAPLVRVPGLVATLGAAFIGLRVGMGVIAAITVTQQAFAAASYGAVAATYAEGLAGKVAAAGYAIANEGLLKYLASTRIGIAVQAAFDAVADANPFALIIIGIVALVAGLTYFFTQTTLGRAVIQVVFKAISVAIGAAVQFISNVIGTVVNVFRAVIGFITANWPLIVTIIGGPIGAVVAFVISHFAQIRAVIVGVFNGIVGFISGVWNTIVAVVRGQIEAVLTVVRTVLAVLVGAWRLEWNVIRTVVSTVFNAIVGFVRSGISLTEAVISGGLNAVVGFFRTGWNAAVAIAESVFGRVVAAVSSIIGRVVSVVAGLGGRITGAIGNFGSLLYNSGRALIQGFINGIVSMFSAIENAARTAMNAAAKFFPHSPAPEGPFSGRGWTLYSGQALMQGLASGITSQKRTVASALGDALSTGPHLGVQVSRSTAFASPSGINSSSLPPIVVQSKGGIDLTKYIEVKFADRDAAEERAFRMGSQPRASYAG